MRVLISGLPLFGKRLAADLQEFDPASSYTFLDTYNSRWAQLKFLLLLPFADLVISMNGVSDRSGSLDWVMRMKKKLILQWMGTDIQIALERQVNQTIDRKYIDYAIHFVDAPWLGEEVAQLGVVNKLVPFKYIFIDSPVEKYEKNAVLSYVPQSREQFYGIEKIIAAAKAFPDIEFNLYGLTQSKFECPANVRLMGWLPEKEFAQRLKKSSVLLRLPEHDGFSVTVVEAWGFGCEVFWTFPGPPAIHVKNQEELISNMRETFKKIEERGFRPNLESVQFASENFKKPHVIKDYIQILKNLEK